MFRSEAEHLDGDRHICIPKADDNKEDRNRSLLESEKECRIAQLCHDLDEQVALKKEQVANLKQQDKQDESDRKQFREDQDNINKDIAEKKLSAKEQLAKDLQDQIQDNKNRKELAKAREAEMDRRDKADFDLETQRQLDFQKEKYERKRNEMCFQREEDLKQKMDKEQLQVETLLKDQEQQTAQLREQEEQREMMGDHRYDEQEEKNRKKALLREEQLADMNAKNAFKAHQKCREEQEDLQRGQDAAEVEKTKELRNGSSRGAPNRVEENEMRVEDVELSQRNGHSRSSQCDGAYY